MDLTQNQKYYFDKIHSKKLRELLKTSFTFFSMTEEQKDEFLIFLSHVHLDKKAEQEVVGHLKAEKKETVELAKETQKDKFTKQNALAISKAIDNEYTATKNIVEGLKKTVRIEQEKDQIRSEEKELNKLLSKLDKA